MTPRPIRLRRSRKSSAPSSGDEFPSRLLSGVFFRPRRKPQRFAVAWNIGICASGGACALSLALFCVSHCHSHGFGGLKFADKH